MQTSWLGSVMSGTTSKPDAPASRFKAGDRVEAQDGPYSPAPWRLATIERVAPYRGREGYYVLWTLPADTPSWVSRGGWKPGSAVREVQS